MILADFGKDFQKISCPQDNLIKKERLVERRAFLQIILFFAFFVDRIEKMSTFAPRNEAG